MTSDRLYIALRFATDCKDDLSRLTFSELIDLKVELMHELDRYIDAAYKRESA